MPAGPKAQVPAGSATGGSAPAVQAAAAPAPCLSRYLGAKAGISQGGPVTAHWLQIFPPKQTVPIYLYYTAPACTKPVPLLTVNTVRAGSGG